MTVVGGPNQRTDYHDDPLEEFFYQITRQHGAARDARTAGRVDMPIREGDIFLLPPHVRHSPQRPGTGQRGPGHRVPAAAGACVDAFEWYCEPCNAPCTASKCSCRASSDDLPPLFAQFYDDAALRTCPACGAVHPGKGATRSRHEQAGRCGAEARIDIHSHLFPRIAREDAQAADPRAPWLARPWRWHGPDHAGRRPFRPVEQRLWDPAARVAWMDEAGLDVQFVCATPVMFGYAWDAARSGCLGRAHERSRARVLCGASDAAETRWRRCRCRTSMPRAARRRARVPAATSACRSAIMWAQASLDDPGILDFLRHCAAERMPVLVHPWDMMGDERMRKWMLPWLVAMPAETQLGMLSLILSGAFERLPRELDADVRAWRRQLRLASGPRRQRVAQSRHRPRRLSAAAIVVLQSLLRRLGDLRCRRAALAGRRDGSRARMLGTDTPFPLGEQRAGRIGGKRVRSRCRYTQANPRRQRATRVRARHLTITRTWWIFHGGRAWTESSAGIF